MEDAGLTQAQIATRLNKTPSYVSRVLNGAQNMTLHTLSDMLWACNVEVRDLDLTPLGIIEVSLEDADEWRIFDVQSCSIVPSQSSTELSLDVRFRTPHLRLI
jgi:transcriptional regulator with XRE-family HTH domain